MMGDWLQLAAAIGQGIGLAVPIIGTMAFFHGKRGERFDRLDEADEGFKKKIDKLDTDFDGLTRQLGTILNDVERRFLTREEGTAAINRLDGSIVELNRTINGFSTQLFELARGRSGA